MADPFARAASFFTRLKSDLSGPIVLVLPHQDVQEMTAERGRELGRLLQAHLDLRARREEAELTGLALCAREPLADGRTRLERGHHRELAAAVGTVRITRCALRSPGRSNSYPAGKKLGLPNEQHSLAMRRLAAPEAVRGPGRTDPGQLTGRRTGGTIW